MFFIKAHQLRGSKRGIIRNDVLIERGALTEGVQYVFSNISETLNIRNYFDDICNSQKDYQGMPFKRLTNERLRNHKPGSSSRWTRRLWLNFLTILYEQICQNSNNMICSFVHKQFTCEVSVKYLKNSSNGYTSNFTSVIEAKSLKVGPGLQIFLKFFGILLTPKW